MPHSGTGCVTPSVTFRRGLTAGNPLPNCHFGALPMLEERDRRKQLVAKMRVCLKQRDMTEPEARMFWKTFLDETADIDIQTYEKVCMRVIRCCDWLPTIAEFRKHAEVVRDIYGAPTQEHLAAEQRNPVVDDHRPKWTRAELVSARDKVKDPETVLGKALLRMLDAVEANSNG
jgi:hypothetical protein